jgi:hypothetical protein
MLLVAKTNKYNNSLWETGVNWHSRMKQWADPHIQVESVYPHGQRHVPKGPLPTRAVVCTKLKHVNQLFSCVTVALTGGRNQLGVRQNSVIWTVESCEIMGTNCVLRRTFLTMAAFLFYSLTQKRHFRSQQHASLVDPHPYPTARSGTSRP